MITLNKGTNDERLILAGSHPHGVKDVYEFNGMGWQVSSTVAALPYHNYDMCFLQVKSLFYVCKN